MSSLFQYLGLATMVASVSATFDPKGVCNPLAPGSGPTVSPDTPEAFQAYTPFSDAALSATTPTGYVQAYSNLLTTYDEPSQFVHYVTMDTYNVDQCAAACDNEDKCNAFTIFFERHPAVKPHFYHCPNPSSTTYIKCDLWTGTILPSISMNHGQIREQFHVVMAGANAYVKDIVFNNTTPDIPTGYAIEQYAFGAAIEAPLDCNGEDTYMGLAFWKDGHFNAQRCITACEQTHDESGRQCHFSNTYMQRRNNVPVIQHCAMFSKHWPAEYATNVGQTRGADEIDISDTDSYGIRDIKADFSACLPSDSDNDNSVAPIVVTRIAPKNAYVAATPSSSQSIETPTTFEKRQLFAPNHPHMWATGSPSIMTEVPDLADAFSAIPTATPTLKKRQLFAPNRPHMWFTTGSPVMTEVPDVADAVAAVPTVA